MAQRAPVGQRDQATPPVLFPPGAPRSPPSPAGGPARTPVLATLHGPPIHSTPQVALALFLPTQLTALARRFACRSALNTLL